MGVGLAIGLKSVDGKKPSEKQTVHQFSSFSPKILGLSKEYLQSEIIDFCLKQQRTRQNI